MRILPVLLVLALGGCFPSRPCIEPPPLSTQDQRDIAVKLAAQFPQIPIGASIETHFSTTSSTAFAQLTDANAAYLMSLQAIDCYLHDGKIGQELAQRLADDLETRMMAAKASPPK